MFENLKTDASVTAETDVVMGGSFILDTNIYDMNVDMAYFDQAASGAMSLNIVTVNAAKQTHKETLWMTSGTAKGGRNFYMVKDQNRQETGEKRYLPGFLVANAICLLTVGKEVGDMIPEEKVINVWNSEAGKEMPTPKQVLTELIGMPISLGILKTIQDITTKVGNDFIETGASRYNNEINKVFRTKDHLTVPEITAEITEPAFYNKWLNTNTTETIIDKTKDKIGLVSKENAANPNSASNTAGTDAAPKKKLFGQ